MLLQKVFNLIIILLIFIPFGNSKQDVSIVATMIYEAVNFKSNLALWLPYIDYFVFTMDYRNSDDSKEVIANIIKDNSKFKIFDHNFTDFGTARTTSLDQAWQSFPQATHILISDPDWKPEVDTIKKNELDFIHDVFRFKIFDRNGATFRQMDWLLRHRKGLRMRYAIHEVLDIGMYSLKVINWVLHEIEQSGSWHTKVGHGNSMSFNRYLFDISLLQREREMYGHDPHTHHYLGITHHAVVDNAPSDFPVDQLNFHKYEAIKYLTLRATAKYDSEFPDERWTGMYSLGLLYQYNIKNFDIAIKWFKICTEYDKTKIECPIALTKLYLRTGSLDDAINSFRSLLQKRVKTKQDDYLTFFRMEQCNVPILGIEILLYKLQLYTDQSSGDVVDDIKLLLLFTHMIKDPICGITDTEILKADALVIIENATKVKGHPASFYKTLLKLSVHELCNDQDFFNYIHSNNINIHPCSELTVASEKADVCSRPFELDMPSSEEMQSSFFGEAIGAASIFDIIHHIHGGNASKLNNLERPYRILFAEYFNDKNIYNLIGFKRRYQIIKSIEIVIITNDDRSTNILETIIRCGYSTKEIKIINKSLDDYLKNTNPSQLFDYIEYFGGISKSTNYKSHLHSFQKLLNTNGVIGLTYFTKNIHQMKIKTLLESSNSSFHYPFSYESQRLVVQYLEDNGLRLFTKDSDLHNFLAGDIDKVLVYSKIALDPKRARIPTSGQVFTQKEVNDIIRSENLEIRSWIPTAYSQPYNELQFDSIQKYKDVGLDQEMFLMTVFPGFRYTVYITKMGSNIPGRVEISEKLLEYDAYVQDRSKVMGFVFSEGVYKAETLQSLKITFTHYGSKSINMSAIFMPQSLASLSLLSKQKITVNELHQMNMKIFRDKNYRCNVENMKGHLFESLKLLEKLNRITIHHFGNNTNNNTNVDDSNGDGRSIENIEVKAKYGLIAFNSTAPDAKKIIFKKGNSNTNRNTNTHTNTNTIQSDNKVNRLKKLGFSI